MEVIKTDIPMKDVTKVMREVGYNKKDNVPNSGAGATPTDQLAEAENRPKKSMADAVNRSMSSVAPVVAPTAPTVLPKVKEEPKGSKSKAVEKLKEKHKEPPKKEKPGEKKTILVDMSTLRTKVTFTGEGWKPLDIKIANNEIIKAFRIKIRDEYRKGIK